MSGRHAADLGGLRRVPGTKADKAQRPVALATGANRIVVGWKRGGWGRRAGIWLQEVVASESATSFRQRARRVTTSPYDEIGSLVLDRRRRVVVGFHRR
jgi:hypothetical protein